MHANRGRKCDTSVAKGYIKNKSRMNEEKENTGIRLNEPATNSAIQHTVKNGSRKQQQQQQHSVCILKWLLDCSDDTSIIIAHIFALVLKYEINNNNKNNSNDTNSNIRHAYHTADISRPFLRWLTFRFGRPCYVLRNHRLFSRATHQTSTTGVKSRGKFMRFWWSACYLGCQCLEGLQCN